MGRRAVRTGWLGALCVWVTSASSLPIDTHDRACVESFAAFLQQDGAPTRTQDGRLRFETQPDPRGLGQVSIGQYEVYEDRKAQSGRMLALDFVVLHALSEQPQPDPVFYMAGGPGQNAAALWRGFLNSWMREERDLVFLSQRGTGGEHRLTIPLRGDDDHLQGYLEPIFHEESFREGLQQLETRADLRLYSTPIAADDLNEVREALGYGQINLLGGSYGTRASLVYLRRHPKTVRSACLIGVAPISFKNPLFHARAAQRAIELVIQECAADPNCAQAFPDLEQEFYAVLQRLGEAPVQTFVRHPASGERVAVELDRTDFAEGLRVMMYSMGGLVQVPRHIHRAYRGDFEPFATVAVLGNRALRNQLAFGMLLSVTCAEDVDRIREEEIGPATRGSFLGEDRVRQQKRVCAFWPRSKLPHDFSDSVHSDVPVLLISGSFDPVTPPEFGAEAARHLSNSLHLTVPAAHGVSHLCVESIQRQFLQSASAEALDISCIESMRRAPFIVDER